MLDAMRKNTKVILWITVVSFVALMVLVWGAEQQVGCGVTQGVIGRVNGEPITLDYFNRVYTATRENFRTSRGGDPGPGDDAQMREQTWNSIVEQVLLMQEARKRGLNLTDEEILTAARSNPPAVFAQAPAFQTNGQFDAQKYLALIDSNAEFALQLENYLRETLPVEKLNAMVYGAAQVSDAEVEQAFRDRNDQARITYRQFELRSYTLPQPVNDQEAETWFKAHPDEFNLPPQATVRYVKVERKPTDADLQDLRNQLGEYAAIARRSAAGDSSAQTFASLAETYSELPSALQGGLMDRFFSPGELGPEMDGALANLSAGGISDVIQDRQGLHIVQVDSVLVENGARKVRIRDLMLKIEPGDATVSDLEDKVNGLREKTTTANFDARARAAGLTVNAAPPFSESGFVRGLEGVAGSVAWAFAAEVGSVSPIFTTNDAWYVLALDRRSEKGPPVFRDVVEVARQKATEARQREMARRDAETFLARMRGAAVWRAAAGADSNQVRVVGPFSRAAGLPGIGRDPEAVAAVFTHNPGEVVGPIDATRGVLVFRVEERKPADMTQLTAQKAQLTSQLVGQRRNEIYQDWLKNLKDKSEIKDFRDLYFRS